MKPNTTIVYTTVISSDIRKHFEAYQIAKKKYGVNDNLTRLRFHEFAQSCEKENKNPLEVSSKLISE